MATETSRTRRLSAAERRDLILSGAMQVFAERGYHDASMAEIASAAGITPAVIYDHFTSKQELHEVLLETQAEALIAFVGRSVLTVGEDHEERMRAGINAFFVFVETHPLAWRLAFRDPLGDIAIATVHTRINQRATEAMAVFIAHAAPKTVTGYPSGGPALEMFGQLLKMSLNGLASWWYEHRDVPREEVVERVMEFCWTGLERLGTTTGEKGN